MYNFEQSHFLLHISPTNGQCSTSMCVYTFVSEFYSVALYRSILQDMYWSEATRLTFGRIWTWFLYSFSKNMLASNGLYIYTDIYIYIDIYIYVFPSKTLYMSIFFEGSALFFVHVHKRFPKRVRWVPFCTPRKPGTKELGLKAGRCSESGSTCLSF